MDLLRLHNLHEHGHDELYALYEIITGRFVFVSTNSYALRLMAMLFSSRYQLILCRLDCASNYTPTIIDNEVASNWTMPPPPTETKLISDLNYHRLEYEVPELIECDPLDECELVLKDLPYMRYVFELLGRLQSKAFNQEDGYVHEVDFLYKDMLSAPFVHSRTVLFNKVLSIVYMEFDFEKARTEIDTAIATYSLQ